MLLQKKKLIVTTFVKKITLSSSMRKFWLADRIQPLTPICPMCNKHEGRFFPQQHLQTFSAALYPAVPLISNSSSSFCSSSQMAELVEGVGKRQSEPYGRDQYMKLSTKASFSFLFFLREEFSIFFFFLSSFDSFLAK